MPSVTLSRPEDKTIIKRAISASTNQIISATVARLYVAYPQPKEWTFSGIAGPVVFCRDSTRNNAFFFRIVDIVNGRGILWEQELYQDFYYHQDTPFFQTFFMDECLAGFAFVDEREANSFYKKVLSRAKVKAKKAKKEKNANKSGFFGTFGFGGKKEERPKIDKNSIGLPSDFRHISHIGWDPEKGLDLQNVNPEWREFFSDLNKYGINMDEMKDPETAEFVVSYVNAHGGIPAKPKPEKKRPPPPPKKKPPVPKEPAPRHPRKNDVAPPSMMAEVGNLPPPPPPPPLPIYSSPSLTPVSKPVAAIKTVSLPPVVTPRVIPVEKPVKIEALDKLAKKPPAIKEREPVVVKQEPVVVKKKPDVVAKVEEKPAAAGKGRGRGRGTAPPPPPPPPMEASGAGRGRGYIPPPPPPPTNMTITPGPRAPTPSSGGGPVSVKAQLPKVSDDRNSLLESIRNAGGINKLKKVDTSTPLPNTSHSISEEDNSQDLAAGLAAALSARRKVLKTEDSEEEEDDDWDD